MALTAGLVTIDEDGVEGGGTDTASRRLYNIFIARANATLADFDLPPLSGADSVPVKQGFASVANDIASWLVTEMTTRAQATITTSDAGLQRDPVAPNAGTLAPTASKFIAIV